jgi:hypothetical protein
MNCVQVLFEIEGLHSGAAATAVRAIHSERDDLMGFQVCDTLLHCLYCSTFTLPTAHTPLHCPLLPPPHHFTTALPTTPCVPRLC